MSSLVQQQLDAAGTAVKNLVDRGHVVLGVRIDAFNNKPTVLIAHTSACAQLRSIPTIEARGDGSMEHFMVAFCGDCRVQWRE